MRVLFVCFGNVCRSPMAEAFFRQLASARPALRDIVIGSAGVAALDGRCASAEAIQVLRDEFGLDIIAHRASTLDRMADADLILTLDMETTLLARQLCVRADVQLLGDYAGTGESVPDPYGDSPAQYSACARLIQRLVRAAADRLETELSAR